MTHEGVQGARKALRIASEKKELLEHGPKTEPLGLLENLLSDLLALSFFCMGSFPQRLRFADSLLPQ